MSRAKDRLPTFTDNGVQDTLPGSSTSDTSPKVGKVQRGVNEAIARARLEGKLDARLDNGAVALARVLAESVDWCRANGEHHTMVMAAARLSDLLTKLQLEPAARAIRAVNNGGIDWNAELAQLSTPTQGSGTTPDRDATQL